jgi:hypothetical protein
LARRGVPSFPCEQGKEQGICRFSTILAKPGTNSCSYSSTLRAIPLAARSREFSPAKLTKQGIITLTGRAPRLGLMHDMANARHAGCSAAIRDPADPAPMALFHRKLAEGRLGVKEGMGVAGVVTGMEHLERYRPIMT